MENGVGSILVRTYTPVSGHIFHLLVSDAIPHPNQGAIDPFF
jgi:hypothetical protein